MIYLCSDIHGEYELFVRLLSEINFRDEDRMIILGDMIDKGRYSVKLLKLIFSKPNIECIIGNHEYDFLKYYQSLMENEKEDFEGVLERLREYFPYDGALIDWDIMDRLEALPLYLEERDFICVHSGLPLSREGEPLPLCDAEPYQLVYDRSFKNSDVKCEGEKCIFFGHTPTRYISGEDKIIVYPKKQGVEPRHITDFYKIHLDTGAPDSGVLSCYCVDTLKTFYVKK